MNARSVTDRISKERPHVHLSRRERQIMDVLYAHTEASAADVQTALPSAPSYSAVRALLQKLVDKGHVAYRQDGARYLYRPHLNKGQASRNAFRRLIDTFFDGSPGAAVVNLLGEAGGQLSQEDVAKIEAELERLRMRAGKSGRKHEPR
ncbi:MAG: BlaI/MecI/CopY family transcriptional regulator [Pseudomonadales bacterium]|nr:BlaI/MecI/CopY family transcriptional regulator [Pseudomonadales bacterium]